MLWLKRPPTPPLLALAERSSLVAQYGVSETSRTNLPKMPNLLALSSELA
jgi:hypothetical protein